MNRVYQQVRVFDTTESGGENCVGDRLLNAYNLPGWERATPPLVAEEELTGAPVVAEEVPIPEPVLDLPQPEDPPPPDPVEAAVETPLDLFAKSLNFAPGPIEEAENEGLPPAPVTPRPQAKRGRPRKN